MKRLIHTKLFCMLEKMDGTYTPGEQETRSVYDDFVHAVIDICISGQAIVPAYFTLHYTRLELEGVRISLSDQGAGKKCEHPKMHRPLPCLC